MRVTCFDNQPENLCIHVKYIQCICAHAHKAKKTSLISLPRGPWDKDTDLWDQLLHDGDRRIANAMASILVSSMGYRARRLTETALVTIAAKKMVGWFVPNYFEHMKMATKTFKGASLCNLK